MPGWYYECAEDFRLPFPVEYELAYIDRTGRLVIEGPFKKASCFKHCRAVVHLYSQIINDEKWYCEPMPYVATATIIIDESGAKVGDETFDSIAPFIDEITIAIRRGQSFIIDLNGNIVKELGKLDAKSVSNNLILANDKQYAERDCYDLEGNLKYSADFDQIRPFYNGLALAKSYRSRSKGTAKNSFSDSTADHAAGYFNYIDQDGKPAILRDYTNGRDFHDGYAAVKQGEKWGLIDQAGQVTVPFDYQYVGDYDSTSGLIPVRKGEFYGFINLKNELVLPHIYAAAKGFSEGLAPFTEDGLHWGFINQQGEVVIAPTYQQAMSFSGGLALVYCNKTEDGHALPRSQSNPMHLVREAIQARGAANLERTEQLLKEVLATAPNSEAAKRAEAFMRSEMPKATVPPGALTLYLKALTAANNGKLEEAKQLYLECIELAPEFELGYGGITFIYIRQNNLTEAERLCHHLLSFNPNYGRAYERLIEINRMRNDHKRADELASQLRKINPYYGSQ